MKKWIYKVACYTYDDARDCWISIFDKRESQTLEELFSALGDEGWELVNVTAELAIPVREPGGNVDFQTISADHGPGGSSIFGKVRPPMGDKTTTIAIPKAPGGFDVKVYRAFFKQEKTKKMFG